MAKLLLRLVPAYVHLHVQSCVYGVSESFGHAVAAPRSSLALMTSTPLTRVDSAGTRLVVHVPCMVAA